MWEALLHRQQEDKYVLSVYLECNYVPRLLQSSLNLAPLQGLKEGIWVRDTLVPRPYPQEESLVTIG